MKQSPTHLAVLTLVNGYYGSGRSRLWPDTPLRNLGYDVKCLLYALVAEIGAFFQLRVVGVPVESKHVVRIF